MRFLVIDKKKRVGDLSALHYAVTRLQEELDARDIAHDFCHFDEVVLHSEGQGVTMYAKAKPLEDYTHIIMRGHRPHEYCIKQYIVEYAVPRGIKVQNSEFIKRVPCYDKVYQMLMMEEAGIPYLESCYRPDGQYHKDEGFLERIGFPLIYKHIEGVYRIEEIDGEAKTKKNVFLIKDVEELKAQCSSRKDPDKYFVQRFVDVGEDYRATLIGGEFIGGWKRKATGGFLTVSKGEYSLHDKPPSDFLELAERVAELFRADYCAVDIIFSDGKPYVLEINMEPGFKAFETKIEGAKVNVARAIVENLLK